MRNISTHFEEFFVDFSLTDVGQIWKFVLYFRRIPHERAFTSVRMKISTKDTKIDEGSSSCSFVTFVDERIFKETVNVRKPNRCTL
jgi:hypothetical protein